MYTCDSVYITDIVDTPETPRALILSLNKPATEMALALLDSGDLLLSGRLHPSLSSSFSAASQAPAMHVDVFWRAHGSVCAHTQTYLNTNILKFSLT